MAGKSAGEATRCSVEEKGYEGTIGYRWRCQETGLGRRTNSNACWSTVDLPKLDVAYCQDQHAPVAPQKFACHVIFSVRR
jgi:hypothetical protein